MTGLAAGMALGGGKVFTYSIANFPTLRCLEQIRNDVAYHGADVKVVAVGGGLAYGALGMSHHATEDLAVMRAIPGLAVAAPGDPVETDAVVADLHRRRRPGVPAAGQGRRADHARRTAALRAGGVGRAAPGGEVAIFSTGAILDVACAAADLLAEHGVTGGGAVVPLAAIRWTSGRSSRPRAATRRS